jgi:hypothetical protein
MTKQSDCVSSLLENIIDYAGLFPPAKLELNDAMAEFLKARKSHFNFICSKFVCPATQVQELKEQVASLGEKGLKVSWLFQSQTSATKLIQSIAQETQLLLPHLENSGLLTTSLEVPLNAEVLNERNLNVEIGEQVFKFSQELQTKFNTQPIDICFEGTWDSNKAIHELARSLSQLEKTKPSSVGTVAAKIRTGGLTSKQIPSLDNLSAAISIFHDFGIPFKATAGLHDPVRHFDSTLNCWMHGFLNLFLSAMLYREGKIKFNQMVELLSETDTLNFSINSKEISWKEHSLSASEVFELRKFALSFGSCSIKEPLQGLQKIGVLDPTISI